MNQAEARVAVCDRWIAQWVLSHSADPTNATYVPYCFEQEKFVEPDAWRPNGTDPQLWARVTLRHTASPQETLGPPTGRRFQREAMIWVQFFGPLNCGLAAFDAVCQEAKTILEGVAYGGIQPMGGAETRELGSDGRWFQVAVVVPITYYETK